MTIELKDLLKAAPNKWKKMWIRMELGTFEEIHRIAKKEGVKYTALIRAMLKAEIERYKYNE